MEKKKREKLVCNFPPLKNIKAENPHIIFLGSFISSIDLPQITKPRPNVLLTFVSCIIKK